MPWINGTYTVPITFVDDTLATAGDQNTQDVDIAGGITNCLAKDGQNAATDDIDLGGNKLVNVGAATGPNDAVPFNQIYLVGEFKFGAWANQPDGWLYCDGKEISRSTYSDLFAAIGTAWGAGNGSTTFNVPDLRGRALFGADGMGGNTASRVTSAGCGIEGTVVGATGGNQLSQQHNHIININDPSHNHSINDPSHSHLYTRPDLSSSGAGGSGTFADHTDDVQTGTSTTGITNNPSTTGITASSNNYGSGSSQNMPPAAMATVVIYAAVF